MRCLTSLEGVPMSTKPLRKLHLAPDLNLDAELLVDSKGKRITNERLQEILNTSLAEVETIRQENENNG